MHDLFHEKQITNRLLIHTMTESKYSPQNKNPRTIWAWVSLLSVCLLFACAVSWHIRLPGLYLDAANPDYLVVDVLHGHSDGSPIWILPGNILFGRIPILTQIYHGTQNVWVALPLVAIFGPSVSTLRESQALFGVAILGLLFFFLRRHRTGMRLWLAWLPAAALALDPVFVYAFRTQLYITLSPVAWLLASLIAAERALCRKPHSEHEVAATYKPAWLMLAGFFYGFSIFGYFIYIFFAPVLLLAVLLTCGRLESVQTSSQLMRVLAWLVAGFSAGISGYLVGYLAIARAMHGLHGFLDWFTHHQHALGAFDQHLSPIQTMGYFADLIWKVFSNRWQHELMFQDATPEPFSGLKLFLLLGLPAIVWIWCEATNTRSWRLRLVTGLIACFPLAALFFGDRLSGHHFVCLLPLSYAALGLGMMELTAGRSARSVLGLVAIMVWIAMLVVNLIGLHSTGMELLRTHGRGLFSDAINHFSYDSVAQENRHGPQHIYLPDWGLLTSFHFLTNGRIRYSTDVNITEMREELCGGQSVTVALISGDVQARFRGLTTQLAWTAPVEHPYLDHEGHEVFRVGKFDASARGEIQKAACQDAESH